MTSHTGGAESQRVTPDTYAPPHGTGSRPACRIVRYLRPDARCGSHPCSTKGGTHDASPSHPPPPPQPIFRAPTTLRMPLLPVSPRNTIPKGLDS